MLTLLSYSKKDDSLIITLTPADGNNVDRAVFLLFGKQPYLFFIYGGAKEAA